VKEETQNEAGQFASDTLCAGTIVVAAISATIFMLSPWISKLLAPSYSQELSSQLGGYIRLFSPILIPLVWMAVFHALLNSNKRFIPGQLEGLYQSVILVIVIILGAPYLGVDSLVIGYWLYATFSAGFLGYQARTYLRKSSRNPFRNPHNIHRLCCHRNIRLSLPSYSLRLPECVKKLVKAGKRNV
jgi:putative peptidoglycan lipid II flippase